MHSFFAAFGYAARGIAVAVKEERNMRFHLCAALYVLVFSSFYRLTRLEYCLLVAVICLVMGMEMINSSIERLVDRVSPEHSRKIGFIKDIAAGAVLVCCIGAAVCGFLLFWDVAVFAQIAAYFATHWVMLALLAVSLVACVWFVFFYGKKEEGK